MPFACCAVAWLFVVAIGCVWVAILSVRGGAARVAHERLEERDLLEAAYKAAIKGWVRGGLDAFDGAGFLASPLAVRATLVGAGPTQANGSVVALDRGRVDVVDVVSGTTLVPGWQTYADGVIAQQTYATSIVRGEVDVARGWDKAGEEGAMLEVEFVHGEDWRTGGEELPGWGVQVPLVRDVSVDLGLCNTDGPRGVEMEDDGLRAKCVKNVCDSVNGTLRGQQQCSTRRYISRICLTGYVDYGSSTRLLSTAAPGEGDVGYVRAASEDEVPARVEGLNWSPKPMGYRGCGDWNATSGVLSVGSWRGQNLEELTVVVELRSALDPRVRLLVLSEGSLHFGYVNEEPILQAENAIMLLFVSISFLCCCTWTACCVAWEEATAVTDEESPRPEEIRRRAPVESPAADQEEISGDDSSELQSGAVDAVPLHYVPVGTPLVQGTVIPMTLVEVDVIKVAHAEDGEADI